MKKRNNWIMLLVLGGMLLTFSNGCRKDDNNNPNNQNNNNNNNNNNNQKVLKFMDIADAKTLFVLNSASKNKGLNEYNVNKLFKITDAGVIVEVTSEDENGDTISNVISPKFLCNLSDDYLTITFMSDQNTNSQINGTFLVRKSDGAVFEGTDLPMSNPGMLPGTYENIRCRRDLFLQYDQLGNIYYYNNQKVMKLEITDPNAPTVSQFSAFGDQVRDFCIDKAGNMIYQLESGASYKYRHATEGFKFIAQYGSFWSDMNNDTIYCKSFSWDNPGVFQIIPSPLEFKHYGDSTFVCDYIAQLVKVKNKNKIIASNGGNEDYGYVMDLYNPLKVMNKYPYSHFGLHEIKKLSASDNYYYIVGTNNSFQSLLLKVDPTDHSFTNLLTTGEYDIFDVVVSSTDEVQFYAVRLLDGNPVLAKIDNSGNIVVISVLNEGSITVLERIN